MSFLFLISLRIRALSLIGLKFRVNSSLEYNNLMSVENVADSMSRSSFVRNVPHSTLTALNCSQRCLQFILIFKQMRIFQKYSVGFFKI